MICQVDIADKYDHKHQNVSYNDQNKRISKMSFHIIKTFIRKLANQGVGYNKDSLRALKATYYRTALDYISSYSFDARMNGIQVDINNEEKIVELFAENIFDLSSLRSLSAIKIRPSFSDGKFFPRKNLKIRYSFVTAE